MKMKKFNTALFCLATLGITAYGLLWPHYFLDLFLSFNEPYLQLRLLVVMVLVSYAFFPEIRTRGMRLLIGLGSVAAIAFGSITMLSPTLLGMLDHYVLLGDIFIFLEGGILTLLLASELPLSGRGLRKAPVPAADSIYSQKLQYSMGIE